MVSRFAEWLASTHGSIALHESLYVWPLIESVHVLALGIFVGLAAMMDLRLLGVTMRTIPMSRVARKLLPWITAGFVVIMITGVVVFYANPVHFYHNIFFRLKLVLLILAGANVWVFHAGIWLSVAAWDLDPVRRRGLDWRAPRRCSYGRALSLPAA